MAFHEAILVLVVLPDVDLLSTIVHGNSVGKMINMDKRLINHLMG